MSDSVMSTNKWGNKIWTNSSCQLHRIDGPAVIWVSGLKMWYIYGEWLGCYEEGFWALWDRLTPEQKKDPVLLSYLPGDFNV